MWVLHVQFSSSAVHPIDEDLLFNYLFCNCASGTNVNEAKQILSTSGLDIMSASDLEEAAQKAVSCLK